MIHGEHIQAADTLRPTARIVAPGLAAALAGGARFTALAAPGKPPAEGPSQLFVGTSAGQVREEMSAPPPLHTACGCSWFHVVSCRILTWGHLAHKKQAGPLAPAPSACGLWTVTASPAHVHKRFVLQFVHLFWPPSSYEQIPQRCTASRLMCILVRSPPGAGGGCGTTAAGRGRRRYQEPQLRGRQVGGGGRSSCGRRGRRRAPAYKPDAA